MVQICAVDFTAYHFLRPLLTASRDAGWDVEFACAPGPWADHLVVEGFDHRSIPVSRSADPLRQLAAIRAMAASLRSDPPDLIHTHTPVGGFVGRTAALAWRGPVVHTVHGLPFESRPRTLIERGFLLTERVLARRTTRFFSQARGDAQRAVRWRIARADDMFVIGNGVDVDRFAPNLDDRRRLRAELGIPPDAVVVLTVARLVREKGLIELADAAALLGPAAPYFLVVGEALPTDRTSVAGELAAHLVIARLGPRWRLLGYRSDVARLLAAADVFVLPTYREGLPRSIIEAMAAGRPVVCTDVGGVSDVVTSGVSGILVPYGDAQALATAIGQLLADPAARERLGNEARRAVYPRYDVSRLVTDITALYSSLVRE